MCPYIFHHMTTCNCYCNYENTLLHIMSYIRRYIQYYSPYIFSTHLL